MHKINLTSRQKVHKIFGKTEENVIEEISHLKKWMQETNLPEVMSDSKLRNMLYLNKLIPERTKEKILMYYQASKKYHSIYGEFNPKLEHIKICLDNTYICNFPELIDDIHRICFIKPKNSTYFNAAGMTKICFALYEVRLEQDLLFDDIIIVDLEYVTFKSILTVTLPFLVKAVAAYKNIYAYRINKFIMLNSPSYIYYLINMFRIILPPKLYARIRVCKDTSILNEMFSVNELPKDFGGNGASLEDYNEMTRALFKKYQKRFDQLDRLRSC